MNKLFRNKAILSVLAIIMVISVFGTSYIYKSRNTFASYDKDFDSKVEGILNDLRNNNLIEKNSNNEDNNVKCRAIVVLKADAVCDKTDISNYNSSIKRKETTIINNQDRIIREAEKITGNKVVVRTGLLVNSFSIDATRKQMKKLAAINGVAKVYEANKYEGCMDKAVVEGSVYDVWTNQNYGYTGEGTVVAVIDSGVNYKHKYMKLDEGVKTKFTKEQWQEKINLLGYGNYFSEKVPFGHDYVDGDDDILTYFHGYHVAGIIGSNGKIIGVAKDSQVISLNALDENNSCQSNDVMVKGIEDAIKLGADVINISIGGIGIITEDNYISQAIEKATQAGVLSCISAGNSGTSTYGGEKITANTKNALGLKDTSMVGEPSIVDSAISIASANNVSKKVANDYKKGKISRDEVLKNVTMSNYSSWGPTNDLNLKPEITAPGGRIKSLLSGNMTYTLDGTSMAAPFVSGSAALIINSMKDEGINLEGEELTLFLKNTMMNTADVLFDNTAQAPYSVRQQGAGLIDVEAAVNNNVLLTYNGKAKVELGEISSSKDIELLLTNYGNTNAEYNLQKAQIYTGYTKNTVVNNKTTTMEYGIKAVEGASIEFNEKNIIVPAHGSVKVIANVILPSNYEKNQYVEAFIKLQGIGVENLGVPVLGFYGDWNEESIIDKPVYDEGKSVLDNNNNLTSYKSMTSLMGQTNGELDGILGEELQYENDMSESHLYNGNKVAFSPNNDGKRDKVVPTVTMLRDAYEVKINVLNESKQVVRKLSQCKAISKLLLDDIRYGINGQLLKGFNNPTSNDLIGWDGTIYNQKNGNYELAKDGQYYIQIISKLGKNTNPQVVEMPVKIDTVEPQISEFEVKSNDNTSQLLLNVKDNCSLSSYYYVYVKYTDKNHGKEVEKEEKMVIRYIDNGKDEIGNYIHNMNISNIKSVSIMIEDEAGNSVIETKKMSDIDILEDGDNVDNDENATAYNIIDEELNDNLVDNANILNIDSIKGKKVSKNKSYKYLGFNVVYLKKIKEETTKLKLIINDINIDRKSLKVNGKLCKYIGRGEYEVDVNTPEAIDISIVSGKDSAGNSLLSIIYLYNSNMRYDYKKIIEKLDTGVIYTNIAETVTDDMVDADGNYVVQGYIENMPKELTINGQNVIVNSEDHLIQYKMKLKKGKNQFVSKTKYGDKEYVFNENINYENIQVELDNNIKVDSKGVINTTKNTFELKGVIKSYFSLASININGNNIYMTDEEGPYSTNKELTNKFDYKVKLYKGINEIELEIIDSIGYKKIINYKVNFKG